MNAAHQNPRRWVVLAGFTLVAGLSQALWLNFAPLILQIEKLYGVTEDTASLLILVFPLLYVLLSIPSGLLIDRKGYRWCLNLAAVIMAACAALRVVPGGFWLLVAAQTGMAIAQPFAVNAISKLVLDWFDEEQGALATGLGTMGLFIGMALGMAATPPMVDAWGMQGAMLGWAVPSVAIAIACALMVSENPAGGGVQTEEIGLRDALGPLLRDRSLLILFAVSAAGLGYFNGLTTWLEPIVAPNGLDAVQAGIIGGVLVLGGIVGAVVIPALSDKFQRRKVFVLGSVVAAIATLWPMVETRDYTVALVSGGAQGFFFLPAYALLLEICSELAGKALAGSATGLLMLAGNGGGVLVIVAMAALKSDADGWKWPIVLMFALLAAALGGTALLPETWHRKLQASSAA